MSKKEKVAIDLDELLAGSGIYLGPAHEALGLLHGSFPQGIPDGAMQRFCDEHLLGRSRAFFMNLARCWERVL